MGKKLNPNASSEAFFKQGEEQVIRLRLIPETSAFAAPVLTAKDLLRGSIDKRRAAELAMIPVRVQLSFAEYDWDQAVRRTAGVAELQGGGTKTPAYREIVPQGIGPVIAPSGESQRETAAAFIAHLKACKAPGVETVRAECMPRLQQAYDALAAALDARKEGEAELALARTEEQAARRDFQRTIDKTISLVRAAFPEDRAKQDLAFPSAPRGRAAEDEGDEDAPAPLSDE